MIKTIDNFHPDFAELVHFAKDATYSDVPYSGHIYPSLSVGISQWAYSLFEKHLNKKVVPIFDYIRKYEAGVKQPSYIHQDSEIAEYTAVLSLRDDNGRLAFWKNKLSGRDHFMKGDIIDYDNENHWDIDDFVDLPKNRCVIYNANLFHSRSPKYWMQSDPRLVQVFFFNVEAP